MRKLLLFTFTILLPAVVVGISNFGVFPDSAITATIMLVVTVGVAGIFTWQSGDATPRISRYCICADFVISAILCLNLGAHWLLAREVSAAKQGVEERYAEEDRELRREKAKTELEIARKQADAELAKQNAILQSAEARRLARLPRSERRSALTLQKPEMNPTPTPAPVSLAPAIAKIEAAPKPTPDQVRESWWWKLTALAFAETFASVLAGAILAGIWEWDRKRNGILDHLQATIDQDLNRTVEQIRQGTSQPHAGSLGERLFRVLSDGRREVVQSTYPGEVGQIWPAELDTGTRPGK
jgi:hypothetical protein